MVKVIYAVAVLIGYAVLGYFKASAKKAEDDLIAEQRKGLKLTFKSVNSYSKLLETRER